MGVTDDRILSGELIEEIASSFEHKLRARGSPLLDSADASEQTLDQVRSILDEVANSCGGVSAMPLGVEILTSQAIDGADPAESLHAAGVLFETALPLMLRAFSAAGQPDIGARATLVLHQVIMNRIASSTVSYTGIMLKTIRDSHRAELARLARDLHDRSAHAIGVAIQNLELHDLHTGRDVVLAHEKLRRAREAMRQALDSVRHFSVESRTVVRPNELEQALTEYLAANAESNVLTSIDVTGDTATLPRTVCEEVYVTLREAIRNALAHSGTTRLEVIVGISESNLRARVSDTGRGFSVNEAEAGEGMGLSSMRKRVQLLGGTLHLSTLLNHGTTTEISIPLGAAVRADTRPISVVLVDDHTLFREGLAELLASDPSLRVVAQGSDGADALALVTAHRPDVVLIDVEMPGPGARATVSRLRQQHRATRIIVLTMHDKPELVLELLDQGAAAYLVKTIGHQELIATVRSAVTNREKILAVSPRTIHQLGKPSTNVVLSARQLEVLQLAALALSNAQIGRQLVIAEGTVKRHLTNTYAKLGAVSRVDAIRKAIAAHLIAGIDS